MEYGIYSINRHLKLHNWLDGILNNIQHFLENGLFTGKPLGDKPKAYLDYQLLARSQRHPNGVPQEIIHAHIHWVAYLRVTVFLTTYSACMKE